MAEKEGGLSNRFHKKMRSSERGCGNKKDDEA